MRKSWTPVILGAALLAGGCTAPLLGIFNSEFLSLLGIGDQAATIPGDAPAVLVQFENRTSRTVQAIVSYRQGSDNVDRFTVTVPSGLSNGQALVCPLTEITLGDVSNLDAIGAIVRLGNETENDAFIEVEPFGVLLRQGANYDCGDAITFVVQPSSATASGYQTVAFIQRAP